MRLEEECNNSRLLLADAERGGAPEDAASVGESFVDDEEPQQEQPRRGVGRPPNSTKASRLLKKKSIEAAEQLPKRKHTKKRVREDGNYDADHSLDYSAKMKKLKKKKIEKHLPKTAATSSEKAVKKSKKRRRPTDNFAEDSGSVEATEEKVVEEDMEVSMEAEHVEEEVHEEVIDVPILVPKKVGLKNLKRPTVASSKNERAFSSQVIVQPRFPSLMSMRSPLINCPIRPQISSATPSPPTTRPGGQMFQIRFPFETRPTPILEKLGASVLARSDTFRPPLPSRPAVAMPSHLHVSRLNQIVSSISQTLLENAAAAQLSSAPPTGVQYILTRPPQSNVGGLALNSVRVPGSSLAGGQNLVFLPRTVVSRQMNQIIVSSKPAATASKQTVFILPSSSVNNTSIGGAVGGANKQSFFVTQGAGGVRQFFLLPNNSAVSNIGSAAVPASGQQSFIFTPRMVASSAVQQPRQVLNFSSTGIISGGGGVVLPSGSFSRPPTQQQFARQLTVVGGGTGNHIVLNQTPGSRQHSMMRSSDLSGGGASMAVTTPANTVPILEKFARQLIGTIPAGVAVSPVLISSPEAPRLGSQFLPGRTDIRLFQRRPNAPFSVSLVGGPTLPQRFNQVGGQVAVTPPPPRVLSTASVGQVVRQTTFISRSPGIIVRTGAYGSQTIVNPFFVGGAQPQNQQQRITLARLPLGNQSRIVLIDSPMIDPSLPRTSPVKNSTNRTN